MMDDAAEGPPGREAPPRPTARLSREAPCAPAIKCKYVSKAARYEHERDLSRRLVRSTFGIEPKGFKLLQKVKIMKKHENI